VSTRLDTENLSEYFRRENINTFLCCSSFEDRCLVIPESLKDISPVMVYIFENVEYLNEISSNSKKLLDIFNNQVTPTPIYNTDPIKTSMAFINVINETLTKNDEIRLALDITTFTRESLLILIRVIDDFKDVIKKITLLYTPAKSMNEIWLSKGVDEFRSVLGFSGVFSPKKPLHLMIMAGFELERALLTIDEYEPAFITIGLGSKDESIRPEFYKKNKIFVDDLVSIFGSQVRTFTFSLIDPVSCKNSILNYLSKLDNYNTLISPMNNKISTIGAGLAALENKDIQLCYAQAQTYNFKGFSTPDSKVYVIDIELDSTSN